jgi:hypothetical protein
MTKKDYILIAATINARRPKQNESYYGLSVADAETLNALARDFAINLAVDNPRFDRAKFLQACGVTE